MDVNNALLAKLNSPVTRFFQLLTEAGWRKSVNTAGKNSLKSVQLFQSYLLKTYEDIVPQSCAVLQTFVWWAASFPPFPGTPPPPPPQYKRL